MIWATKVPAYRRIARAVRAGRNENCRTRKRPLFPRTCRPCKLFGNSLRAAKDSSGQHRIACTWGGRDLGEILVQGSRCHKSVTAPPCRCRLLVGCKEIDSGVTTTRQVGGP